MRHKEPSVRSYAVTHPTGEVRLPTQAGWDQVLYSKSGLFVASSSSESWTVPPHRALCVTDGTTIRARTRRPTAMRCLYFRHELKALRSGNRVVSTNTFTRELLLHVVKQCPISLATPSNEALIQVVLDQIAAAPTAPLHLPFPADSRAQALATVLTNNPTITLGDAIATVAASRRTLERIFRSETAMTLAGWQRRSRILFSLDLLSQEKSMTEIALASGYATSSSYIAAFRSELNSTPKKILNENTPSS